MNEYDSDICSLLLPHDILVEIALLDWRVYNAIVRADKALNKRLRNIDKAQIGNYIKYLYTPVHIMGDLREDYIKRYRNMYYINTGDYRARIYFDGKLRRIVDYTTHEDTTEINEIRRFTELDNVKYEESVIIYHGEVDSICRTRRHPRGYVMHDTYSSYSYSMRFDDGYLGTMSKPRYEPIDEAGWRINESRFFIYDYKK
jgi:hypothetical protein